MKADSPRRRVSPVEAVAGFAGRQEREIPFPPSEAVGIDFRGQDLRDKRMVAAELCGARLDGADLTGADLTGANLSAASLGGAELRGANLSWALLRGADLTGADLTNAVLRGAVYDPHTRWPDGFDAGAAGAWLAEDENDLDIPAAAVPQKRAA